VRVRFPAGIKPIAHRHQQTHRERQEVSLAFYFLEGAVRVLVRGAGHRAAEWTPRARARAPVCARVCQRCNLAATCGFCARALAIGELGRGETNLRARTHSCCHAVEQVVQDQADVGQGAEPEQGAPLRHAHARWAAARTHPAELTTSHAAPAQLDPHAHGQFAKVQQEEEVSCLRPVGESSRFAA